jgi:hypothetical protein
MNLHFMTITVSPDMGNQRWPERESTLAHVSECLNSSFWNCARVYRPVNYSGAHLTPPPPTFQLVSTSFAGLINYEIVMVNNLHTSFEWWQVSCSSSCGWYSARNISLTSFTVVFYDNVCWIQSLKPTSNIDFNGPMRFKRMPGLSSTPASQTDKRLSCSPT